MLGVSLLAGLLTYFLTPLGGYPWPYLFVLPAFFVGYYFVQLGGVFLFLWIGGLFIKKDKDYEPSAFASFVLHEVCFQLLVVNLVAVKKNGTKKLPKGPAFYIFNHTSSFDPIVYLASRKFYRHCFISKPDNQDQALIGPWIRWAGYISISRDNAIKAAASIYKAAQYLKERRCSIAVSPEGTRSQKRVLLPFHAAVFEAPLRAGCPIVVLAMQNNAEIHERPLRFTTVYMDVVEVIPYSEYKDMKADALSKKCHDDLEKYLISHQDRLYHKEYSE